MPRATSQYRCTIHRASSLDVKLSCLLIAFIWALTYGFDVFLELETTILMLQCQQLERDSAVRVKFPKRIETRTLLLLSLPLDIVTATKILVRLHVVIALELWQISRTVLIAALRRLPILGAL